MRLVHSVLKNTTSDRDLATFRSNFRSSRVRYAAPNYGAPLTTGSGSQENLLRRGKGGLWDICTLTCPTAQRFVSDPPAVPRLRWTARRSFSSRCAIESVSRPAGPLKFNLRGRRYAVPANGCLVTLMRWPNLQRIQFGKSLQAVNPATVASPEIFPISPRRCVFSLDKSLSWMSNAFTSAFQKLDPIPQFRATAKLGRFLEEASRAF